MGISRLLLGPGLLIVAVGCLQAQETAELSGSVVDPQKAVIPGVVVTVTRMDTSTERKTVTNSDGIYILPSLQPGRYEIQCKKEGFQTLVRSDVELHVADRLRLDFELSVGQVSQAVTVGTAGELVDTTATIGQIINNKEVVNLPLNGRTYTQLAALSPGIVLGGASALPRWSTYQTPTIVSGGGVITISGARPESNEFAIDGLSVTASMNGGTIAFPPIDAIQEFKLLETNYGGEFGFHPAQVVLTTKTGTNAFHGSLYEFLRNDALAATYFFNNLAGIGNNPLRMNQFGGSVGGPVYLPKYSGKDKTFFFVNYEGTRLGTGATQTTTVPTALMRQGNFSELSKAIVDPTTNQPFPGNIIPYDRLSPIALNTIKLALYPSPNQPGLANNYTLSPVNTTTIDEVVARIDHNLSETDRLSGTIFWETMSTNQPRFTLISPNTEDIPVQAYSIGETHTFSPTLLNEVKAGWSRINGTVENTSPKTLTNADLGFPQNGNQPNPFGATAGIAEFDPSGYGSLGANTGSPFQFGFDRLQLNDSISWSRKAHILKIGGTFIRNRDVVGNGDWRRGQYSFNGQYSNNAFSDFLLSLPSSAIRNLGAAGADVLQDTMFSNHYAVFVQDDWRISPRVTLNLGLRYENHRPVVEEKNRFSTFIPGLVNGTPGIVQLTAPDPTYGRCLCKAPNLDFAPRLGIAYQLDHSGKTVVRAGYGIAYDLHFLGVASHLGANPPWFQKQTITNPIGAPTFDLANSFLPAVVAGGGGGYATPLNPLEGRVQQWTLDIQRELGHAIVLDVNYRGSSSDQLVALQPLNAAVPGPGAFASRRPYPNYPVYTQYTSGAAANYQGGTVQVKREMWKGVTFTTHYTWSKSLDDASYGVDGQQNPTYDLLSNWGLSTFNISHRFVASAVYELPFGRGRAILSHVQGPINALVSGWSIAPIYTVQSGFPFTVLASSNTANIEAGSLRADAVGDPSVPDPTRLKWFNTAAFAQPALYQYGSASRNSLIGPGMQNLDLAAMKDMHLWERMRLQFRGEFFNALNRVNFALPNATLGTSNFGTISSAAPARVIQFGLKVLF